MATKLVQVLLEAKKAVGALVVVEAGAVANGLLNNAEAGYVTAGLGIVSSAIVWALDNAEKAVTVSDTGPGTTIPAQPPAAVPPATPAA